MTIFDRLHSQQTKNMRPRAEKEHQAVGKQNETRKLSLASTSASTSRRSSICLTT